MRGDPLRPLALLTAATSPAAADISKQQLHRLSEADGPARQQQQQARPHVQQEQQRAKATPRNQLSADELLVREWMEAAMRRQESDAAAAAQGTEDAQEQLRRSRKLKQNRNGGSCTCAARAIQDRAGCWCRHRVLFSLHRCLAAAAAVQRCRSLQRRSWPRRSRTRSGLSAWTLTSACRARSRAPRWGAAGRELGAGAAAGATAALPTFAHLLATRACPAGRPAAHQGVCHHHWQLQRRHLRRPLPH